MTYRLFILASLILCIACDSDQNNLPTLKDPFYSLKNVPCSQPDQLVIDTVFPDNIHLSIRTECMPNLNYIDTVEIGMDTFDIRQWRDIKLIIKSSTFGEVQFKKATVGDSLASDLWTNGFLVPPYDINYNLADSSIVFKSFIGHADSDVGDIYIVKIDRSGQITIQGRDTPNDGE